MECRPWGVLDWALELSKPRQWDFLGALGTEERSLAAWHWLREMKILKSSQLLEIRDLHSRHTLRANELLLEREKEFRLAGGNSDNIHRKLELLSELHRITHIGRESEGVCGGSLLLDITSLPKRFFFPLLRHFEGSQRVRDLVVTYTSASQYIDNEPLSENPTDWQTLPGFAAPDGLPETLIVGAGFLVESLHGHLASINRRGNDTVKMLIPFPSPVSVLRRAWDAVFCLESKRSPEKFEHYRVGSIDLNGTFERIVSLARNASARLAFAPFGPKPISAAMCLYASQSQSAVYYPQPRVYHPEYSKGVGEVDGKRAVYAYWIKHRGQNLYALQN